MILTLSPVLIFVVVWVLLGSVGAVGVVVVEEVAPKKEAPKKSVEGSPKLVLESNKYVLTDSAMALMGVHPDDKLEIKYESSKELVEVLFQEEL